MSQGFANTGAKEVKSFRALLEEQLAEGRVLLESNRQVLSEIKKERTALSEERAAAAVERKALQVAREKTREKTRQAGQRMRADFLKGLEEEARKAGTEQIEAIRKVSANQIEAIRSGSAQAAGRVVDAIEERLGTAVEMAAGASRDARQKAKGASREVRGAMSDLKEAAGDARRAAAQAAWKPTTVAVVMSLVIPALLYLSVTWMRPGWNRTAEQQRAMEAGQAATERYERLQRTLQRSLSTIGSLESGQWKSGRPLTEAEREELRGEVMSLEEMQKRLEEMEAVRSAVGWGPSEQEQRQIEQVKALQEKDQ